MPVDSSGDSGISMHQHLPSSSSSLSSAQSASQGHLSNVSRLLHQFGSVDLISSVHCCLRYFFYGSPSFVCAMQVEEARDKIRKCRGLLSHSTNTCTCCRNVSNVSPSFGYSPVDDRTVVRPSPMRPHYALHSVRPSER